MKNSDTLKSQINSFINSKRPSKNLFYLDSRNYKPSPTRELSHISFIRSKLFTFSYFRENDFYDIPQTILMFTLNDEICRVPNFPNWAQRFNVPMNNIKYDRKNLKSVLKTFLLQIIIPRFRDSMKRVEQIFTQKIVIPHLLDDAIRLSTQLSFEASQYIKHYADFQMMNGEHKIAYSLYHQLVLHFPSKVQGEKLSSALKCAISCDIIIGEISEKTVELLNKLIDNDSRIANFSLIPINAFSKRNVHALLDSLILFWVLPRTDSPSPNPLLPFISEKNDNVANLISEIDQKFNDTEDEKIIKVIEPFLREQIIQYSSIKRLPLLYFELSKMFLKLEMHENYTQCLWNCICLLRDTNCGIALSYLLENLFRLLNKYSIQNNGEKSASRDHNNENNGLVMWENAAQALTLELGHLMRFSDIPKLPMLTPLLDIFSHKLKDQNFANVAGFLQASVHSYSIRNPIKTGPKKFMGNWPQTAQRLFGVSSPGSFFSIYNVAHQDNSAPTLLAPGDEVTVTVSLHVCGAFNDISLNNKFLSDYGAHSISLYVKSEEENIKNSVISYEIKSNHCSINEGKTSTLTLKVVSGCSFSIFGVEVIWAGGARLIAKFRMPLNFFCNQDAPTMTLKPIFAAKEILAGEAQNIKLSLRVGPMDLSYLSLFIVTDAEVNPLRKNISLETKSEIIDEFETQFVLVKPENVKSTAGQYFLGAYKSNEVINVNIVFATTICGKHSNWLFFAFKSEKDSHINRYVTYHHKVRVYENESKIAMYPSFFGLAQTGITTSITKLQDSNSFCLTIFNNNKRKVIRNVHISLIDNNDVINEKQDENQEYEYSPNYIINGFTKKLFKEILPQKSSSFKFQFLSTDNETFPCLKIIVDGKEYLSDTSIYFGQYFRK